MNRFFAKLGFVHRQLWNGNRLYQLSVLAGPAPLLGAILAGALWAAGLSTASSRHPPPPWATPEPRDVWNSTDGPVQSVTPRAPLPPADAAGGVAGYKPGWRLATQRIEVRPGYDVNVETAPLTAVTLDGARIEMDRIIASGPKQGLYAGVAQAQLAIRAAGIYTLSLRFERPPAEPADCLMRLGFGQHRVVSNLDISVINQVTKTFDGTQFELQPGLYPIGVAFSCWHDQNVTAPGSLTLLIGHPGDQKPLPARPDDIVRREGDAVAN